MNSLATTEQGPNLSLVPEEQVQAPREFPAGIGYTLLREQDGRLRPVFFGSGTEVAELNEASQAGELEVPHQPMTER